MARGDLTDGQWERLGPLLPSRKPKRGRPARDHRTIINGFLWVLCTGAPWRDLPERYGPWQTVASRFWRWRKAGIWDWVLAELRRQADAEGRLASFAGYFSRGNREGVNEWIWTWAKFYNLSKLLLALIAPLTVANNAFFH